MPQAVALFDFRSHGLLSLTQVRNLHPRHPADRRAMRCIPSVIQSLHKPLQSKELYLHAQASVFRVGSRPVLLAELQAKTGMVKLLVWQSARQNSYRKGIVQLSEHVASPLRSSAHLARQTIYGL